MANDKIKNDIEEFGIEYEINNRSFFQVNDFIKKQIYQKIIETIGGNKIIIDAYSGAGLLSSILARHSKKVLGVEIEKEESYGDRDLCYEVKKQKRGRFLLFIIKANPSKIVEVDRQFKLNSNLLKFMFVKVDE